MQDIKEQMSKRNIFFHLKEIKHHNQSKVARVESLQPRFETGTIWFPEQAKWLAETEQELLMFSKTGRTALHDDIPDALAMMTQETTAPINLDRQNVNQNIRYSNLPRESEMTTIVR